MRPPETRPGSPASLTATTIPAASGVNRFNLTAPARTGERAS